MRQTIVALGKKNDFLATRLLHMVDCGVKRIGVIGETVAMKACNARARVHGMGIVRPLPVDTKHVSRKQRDNPFKHRR
jgi:putative ubiquitin-RnfH superfamily antitoxin RatB of RatAB toxin-antitoxin module